MLQVRLHDLQVAVIDADQLWVETQHSLQVGSVMELDQSLHPQPHGSLIQVGQLGIIQALGDEQDAIGADGTGLQDLILVEDEVLPEQWHVDGLANLPQIVEVPLKVFLVGQDAETRRSVFDVRPGNLGGREVGPDQARRRRGPLHLGNQSHRMVTQKGGFEVAYRWCGLYLPLKFRNRHAVPRSCHFGPFMNHDLLKDVCHLLLCQIRCRCQATR